MRTSDLDVAVTEGIISRDQSQQLRDLSRRLSSVSDEPIDFDQETRDEPFRLLRGFRDFFIAIALAIFVFGISGVAAWFIPSIDIMESVFTGDTGARLTALGLAFGLLLVGAGLAEWITRYQRLPLSSLILAVSIAAWSAAVATMVMVNVAPSLYTQDPSDAIAATLWTNVSGATIGLIVYYWRYRLPFALLPLAGVAAFLLFLVVQAFTGEAWIEQNSRIVIGILGLGVFVVAMSYDMRDRLRVSRFSECAFWLHLMAAPMMVHSLLGGEEAEGISPVVIISIMVALGLVAILIDRRPLLVSGIIYLGVAISQLVESFEAFADVGFMMTALILGGVLLFLGLGWTPIRRVFLQLLPFKRLKELLPPAIPA